MHGKAGVFVYPHIVGIGYSFKVTLTFEKLASATQKVKAVAIHNTPEPAF